MEIRLGSIPLFNNLKRLKRLYLIQYSHILFSLQHELDERFLEKILPIFSSRHDLLCLGHFIGSDHFTHLPLLNHWISIDFRKEVNEQLPPYWPAPIYQSKTAPPFRE